VKDEDNVRRHVDEEHTTLVDQPSGRYLGFATPNCGSGMFFRRYFYLYAQISLYF
jgi:hypothetical protein